MSPHPFALLPIALALLVLMLLLLTGCFPEQPTATQATVTQVDLKRSVVVEKVRDELKKNRSVEAKIKRPDVEKVECPEGVDKSYCGKIARKVRRHFPLGMQEVAVERSITTMMIESSGNPQARNPESSAKCLFQIVDSTARHLGVRDIWDVDQCIEAGVKYLSWCTVMWTKSSTPRRRTHDEAFSLGHACYHDGAGGPLNLQKKYGCRYWYPCFDKYANPVLQTYVRRADQYSNDRTWYQPDS